MKLGDYAVMLLVMMVILQFIGIPTGIESSLAVINVNITAATGELVTADLANSEFWLDIFNKNKNKDGEKGWLIFLGIGAIALGLFAKGYDTSLVILPLVIATAVLFIGTFWSVISYVGDSGELWMTNLVAVIFIGLSIGFLYSCVDYFAGR